MSFLIHTPTTRTSGYIRLHDHMVRPTREEVAHMVRASVQRVSATDLRARLDTLQAKRTQRLLAPFIDAIAHTTHIERDYPTYIDMLTQDATMWAGGDIEPTCKALDAAAARIVPTWAPVVCIMPTVKATWWQTPTLGEQALQSLTMKDAA